MAGGLRVRRSRSDELENQLNRGALWAVTYGDLMSYLMIFFLILFSLGLTKAKGAASERRQYEEVLVRIQKVFGGKGSSPDYERLARREREESMVTQIREAVDKQALSQYAQVESSDKKLRLVLAEAILFDSGKAELRPKARDLLGSLAEQFRGIPNPIVIEGHTDNVPLRGGRFGSNRMLSMARADVVVRFLEERGVAADRLAGIGYGEFRPVAENRDPVGRARNRRIEIDVIRTE